MLLLYLALAYAAGILLGRWTWEQGWWPCHLWPGLWLVPFLLFPLAYFLHRHTRPATTQLRWPAWAGFEPPRRFFSPGVWLAMAVCVSIGGLRYVDRPLTPCFLPHELAYWALPADQAFDRDAPEFIVEGTIAGYPLLADRRQRVVIRAHRLYLHDNLNLDDASGGTAQTPQPNANQDNLAQSPGLPVEGLLRVNTDLRRTFVYGQSVRVTGRMVQPPEFDGFSYREYLAVRDIHTVVFDGRVVYSPVISTESSTESRSDAWAGAASVGEEWAGWFDGMRARLYALRSHSERMINRTLPEPHAGLANGMLLGIESGIPDAVYAQFNRTSTSHVIVISGANVAVVIGLMIAVARAVVGTRLAAVTAIGAVFFYTILVGGDASVTRAALMGSLGALALSVGRRQSGFVGLAVAGWAMALFNPAVLWDVSFQLSVAATAGLLIFVPRINGWLTHRVPGFRPGPLALAVADQTGPRRKIAGVLRGLFQDGIILTVAANITVLPLLLYHFGRLSVTALPANFAIAPVQPYIMIWGSAALIADWLGASTLAAYLLWIPWLCLEWTWTVVQWFDRWEGEGATWAGFGVGHGLAFYVLLLFVLNRRRLWQGTVQLRGESLWPAVRSFLSPLRAPVLTGLAVVVFLVWRVALSQPDGNLHVYFLDVGQGDGIFIQTPGGRQVLIDGGSSPQRLQMELAAVMPFWDRTLDLLVLTHPDSDHMAGQIAVPARYRIDYGVDTAAGQENLAGEPWRNALAANDVAVVLQHAGGWIDLGDGVALWVLWPPPGGYVGPDGSNENSLVLRLVYGHFSALLTGDAGLPSEAALLDSGVPLGSTVLKVGHHGSRHSTGPAFVAAVEPWLAVIQVGENRYGHPHPQVLENLAQHTVLRNDIHGRVHVRTDGASMWVHTQRGEQ